MDCKKVYNLQRHNCNNICSVVVLLQSQHDFAAFSLIFFQNSRRRIEYVASHMGSCPAKDAHTARGCQGYVVSKLSRGSSLFRPSHRYRPGGFALRSAYSSDFPGNFSQIRCLTTVHPSYCVLSPILMTLYLSKTRSLYCINAIDYDYDYDHIIVDYNCMEK